jgi:hypothetical protein
MPNTGDSCLSIGMNCEIAWTLIVNCIFHNVSHRLHFSVKGGFKFSQGSFIAIQLRNMLHQHTYVGLVDAHLNEGQYADDMKYSSAVTAQAHIRPEQVVVLVLVVLGKLHGTQKRNTQAERKPTNQLKMNLTR